MAIIFLQLTKSGCILLMVMEIFEAVNVLNSLKKLISLLPIHHFLFSENMSIN